MVYLRGLLSVSFFFLFICVVAKSIYWECLKMSNMFVFGFWALIHYCLIANCLQFYDFQFSIWSRFAILLLFCCSFFWSNKNCFEIWSVNWIEFDFFLTMQLCCNDNRRYVGIKNTHGLPYSLTFEFIIHNSLHHCIVIY